MEDPTSSFSDQPAKDSAEGESSTHSNTESLDGPFASPVGAVHTPGQQIDRYTVRELLGVGGFGIVYRAEQVQPIRRMVALKVLKPGMDSTAVLNRFEAERQALARMDHPSIAKIFDGGMTAEGRPFFVMELIEGESITKYSDVNHFTIRQRIELMVRVCDAVHHAHSKGVIHRDIKPSNVMLSNSAGGEPLPKVIDFGIAKALGSKLGEETLVTQVGQLMGTPEYMSPEQADIGADDIDTRSDVYALGVMLYELLSGERPFKFNRLVLTELQRVIREVEPQRPSSRLLSGQSEVEAIAHMRSIAPKQLVSTLRHELEWIPLKAMRKNREERYASAAEMADDLRRYLSGQALIAGPQSTVYHFRKFAIRYRYPLAAAGALVAVLVGATAVSTHFYLRARSDQQITEAVNQYMNDDILQSVATEGADTSLRMVDVLDAAERSVSTRFGDQASVESGVRLQLARAFARLGLSERALAQVERIDILADLVPLRRKDALEMEAIRAEALYRDDRAAEGLAKLRDLLAEAVPQFGPKSQEALTLQGHLASALKFDGQLDEAQALYEDELVMRSEVDGPLAVNTLVCRHNLALISLERSKRTQDSNEKTLFVRSAAEQMESVVDDMLSALGDRHLTTIGSATELPALWHRVGEYDKARARYERVLPLADEVLGLWHWRALDIRANYGALLMHLKEHELALEVLTHALEGLLRRGDHATASAQLTALRLATAQLELGLEDSAFRTLNRIIQASDPGDHQTGLKDPDIRSRCADLLHSYNLTPPVQWQHSAPAG